MKSQKKQENLIQFFVEPLTVFPIKLHSYLNTVWKREGKEKKRGSQAGKVKIFEPADGLRLLLNSSSQTLSRHMLERFMQHAQGYFITLCRSTGKNEISSLPNKEIYPGILGVLLSKLEKNKEDFMSESAFLLGRCLRIADELHRLYCEIVRKNEMPSELVRQLIACEYDGISGHDTEPACHAFSPLCQMGLCIS